MERSLPLPVSFLVYQYVRLSGDNVYFHHHPDGPLNDAEVVLEHLESLELYDVKWEVLLFEEPLHIDATSDKRKLFSI